MPNVERDLRRELRQAGFANSAVDAVWPDWWSSEAENSISAAAELRYTVSRRLGISPKSLFDGPARFLWRDETRFKSLSAQSEAERQIVAAFGTAAGRLALSAAPQAGVALRLSATAVRAAILQSSSLVDAESLVSLFWSAGIPVIALEVFPLQRKRMQAMTVGFGDRFAVLVARTTRYASYLAWLLAHELGHIALSHVHASSSLVDESDPVTGGSNDEEELSADRYALEILTGSPEPSFNISGIENQNAPSIANAVIRASAKTAIDPGILALCLGHQQGNWAQINTALRHIPPGPNAWGKWLNEVAFEQFQWANLSAPDKLYLSRLIGQPL